MSEQPGGGQKEFLLGLSGERLASVEKALERNWIVHLVLAGVGVALVFEIGELPRFLSKYVSQDEYNLQPVAAILLAVLLYYFMKFGHLLTAFIEARRLNESLLRDYLGDTAGEQKLKPLRETTSFFEGYYSPDAFGGRGPLIVAYYLVSPIIISAGQAASLFLILRAYGTNPWSISAVALAGIVLVLLYREFWRSKRDHPRTTQMVLASVVLVICWLALFAITAAEVRTLCTCWT